MKELLMNSRRFLISLAAILALGSVVALGESATDTKSIGVLSVEQLHVGTLDGASIIMPFGTKALGSTYTVTNAAQSVVKTELNSNGVYVVTTNSIGATVTTNANLIAPRYFYGKAGLLLTAPTTGYSASLPAPGTTLTRYVPSHYEMHETLGSNGVFAISSNLVAAATVLVPAAAIGQVLNIVAATNMTFLTGSTVLPLPATTNYTMVAGSVLTVTPISGSKWKALMFVQ